MANLRITYTVSAQRSAHHLLDVSVRIEGDLPEPLEVAMPAWTPGSYLVREYARHVEGLTATAAEGAPRPGIRKVAKDRWIVAHGGARDVTLHYAVYAHDLTVRTNHADSTHAYWNGAATYLRPVGAGLENATQTWRLVVVPPQPGWRVATGLPEIGPAPNEADIGHVFEAPDFDALCDCPVELGVHERHVFTVLDRAHELVVWGPSARMDAARVIRDITRIVECEAEVFGGLPYERYLFLLHVMPGGRGGLEHENSCTLQCPPEAFDNPDAYDDLLSLVAHEFLHLWNVKRIKPAGLTPYVYERENYTRLLWLFEGGTSYYDWLFLRRAGLVDAKSYLRHLAGEISRLEDTPGRFAQSLEEASFDAWIKLYRPDEHSVNSTISYYLKGEVVCALLDLEIRARSGGTRSLDDVMRHLWRTYGQTRIGVPETAIEREFAAATDMDLSDVIDVCIRTTESLPYHRVLARAGLQLRARPGRGATMGLRMRADGARAVIGSVLRGSPAEHGGLSPGDEILALDRRRVDDNSFRDRLRWRKPGDAVAVLYARREQIHETEVVLGEPPPDGFEIAPAADATAEARSVGEAWLGAGSAALWSVR